MSTEVQAGFEEVRRRLVAMEERKPGTRVSALIGCALHFVEKGIEEAQGPGKLPAASPSPMVVQRRD